MKGIIMETIDLTVANEIQRYLDKINEKIKAKFYLGFYNERWKLWSVNDYNISLYMENETDINNVKYYVMGLLDMMTLFETNPCIWGVKGNE